MSTKPEPYGLVEFAVAGGKVYNIIGCGGSATARRQKLSEQDIERQRAIAKAIDAASSKQSVRCRITNGIIEIIAPPATAS